MQKPEAAKARPGIMMLTAKGSEDDVVAGFQAGADDYVSKPFSLRELMVRVEAILRRAGKSSAEERLEFSGIVLDGNTLTAASGENVAELTRREMEIVRYLHLNRGRIVSKAELLTEVWNYATPTWKPGPWTSTYCQACVVGEGKKYLAALVTLEPESAKAYANRKQIAFSDMNDLSENPQIRRLIESEIKEVNSNLPSFETIKTFVIVPEFSIEDGLVTPTLKLKKSAVLKKYADLIPGLYPDEGAGRWAPVPRHSSKAPRDFHLCG